MADEIKKQLDKTEKLIGGITPMVSLVDDDGNLKQTFTANGNKYTFMSANLVFNIKRRKTYEDLNRMFSTGKTPTEQWQDIQKTKSLLVQMSTEKDFKKGISELWKHIFNQEEAFKNVTNKYSIAMYISTLFCIKEGEDVTDWDFEAADNKIEDWVKENINPNDFLSIALSSSTELMKILNES